MKEIIINPRNEKLLQIINKNGYAGVDELAVKLNVSTQTIRRDIKKLHDVKLLVRHHGGAGRYSTSVTNIDYSIRQTSNTDEKKAIAKKIMTHIPDNCTIFLSIGTTTETIAKYLLKKSNLRIITNSLKVANILHTKKDFEIIIPAGRISAHNGGINYLDIKDFIKQFRVDYLITSCGTIDDDGTLLDYDVNEVAIVKTMMKLAKKTFLAVDSTKYNTNASIEMGKLKDLDTFYTDKMPSDNIISLLHSSDIKLEIA